MDPKTKFKLMENPSKVSVTYNYVKLWKGTIPE